MVRKTRVKEDAAGGSVGGGAIAGGVALDGGSYPAKKFKIPLARKMPKSRKRRKKVTEGSTPGMERAEALVAKLKRWRSDEGDFHEWMSGDDDDVDMIMSWIEDEYGVQFDEREDARGRLVYDATSKSNGGSLTFKIRFADSGSLGDIDVAIDFEPSARVAESREPTSGFFLVDDEGVAYDGPYDSHADAKADYEEHYTGQYNKMTVWDGTVDPDTGIVVTASNGPKKFEAEFYAVIRVGTDIFMIQVSKGNDRYDDYRKSGWVESHVEDLAGSAQHHRVGGANYMSYLSADEVMGWLSRDYDDVWGPYESEDEARTAQEVEDAIEDRNHGEYGHADDDDDMIESRKTRGTKLDKPRNPVAKNAHLTTKASAGFHSSKKYDRAKSKKNLLSEDRNVFVTQTTDGKAWMLVDTDTAEVVASDYNTKARAVIAALGKGFEVVDEGDGESRLETSLGVDRGAHTDDLTKIMNKGPFENAEIERGQMHAELMHGFSLRGAAASVGRAIGARAVMRGQHPAVVIGKQIYLFKQDGMIGVTVVPE